VKRHLILYIDITLHFTLFVLCSSQTKKRNCSKFVASVQILPWYVFRRRRLLACY